MFGIRDSAQKGFDDCYRSLVIFFQSNLELTTQLLTTLIDRVTTDVTSGKTNRQNKSLPGSMRAHQQGPWFKDPATYLIKQS